MEMHQVRYFIAAARLLNFTRAALECNVSQPALTKAILKLEEEFGGPLFRRERARTHLTELGKAMLPHLQRTFDAAQAARQLARDMERATVAPLSIGISRIVPDELFAPIFRDLLAALAGIELGVTTASDRELVELAMAGSLDVIVLALPPDAPERFERWPLFADEFRIAVHAGHGLAETQMVTPVDLENEAWIDLAGDGCEALSRFAATAGAAIAVRHQAQHAGMVRQLVLGGLGCGWLPRRIIPSSLVAVPAAVPGSGIEIVVASVAGRRRAVAADAFLRACRAHSWADGDIGADIAAGYRTDAPAPPSPDRPSA
ncbi:LysR family transcriptional regulator [Novosphingobium sp.]|uniref:LysR family transcriptional regulator n=1 Tax=Novosphingobium sp. TaxID=1874826 RepID=UPI00262D1FBE|nr:LysR family transcriptional regulator [Novosphingobium sp.]